MPDDSVPAPMSPAQALDAAASDADANAGEGNVGDAVAACAGTPLPTSSGAPSSGSTGLSSGAPSVSSGASSSVSSVGSSALSSGSPSSVSSGGSSSVSSGGSSSQSSSGASSQSSGSSLSSLSSGSSSRSSSSSSSRSSSSSSSRSSSSSSSGQVLRLWLFDASGQRMPVGTAYRLTMGGQVRSGKLRQKGLVEEQGLMNLNECTIEWGDFQYSDPPATLPGDDRLRKILSSTHPNDPLLFGTSTQTPHGAFTYRAQVFLNTDHGVVESPDIIQKRLANMGYGDPSKTIELDDFGDDYQIGESPDNQVKASLRDVHRYGTERPQQVFPGPNEDSDFLLCGGPDAGQDTEENT
jgi:hypothetical protein